MSNVIPDPAPLPSKPYPCHCPPSTPQGTVLLFYRYYAAPPALSTPPHPTALQSFHTNLATPLNLTGKLRLSSEGFNITIAGPTPAIKSYITACIAHESFAGLPLSTPAEQNAFFKPSPGCSCVFPALSIRICDEITPMAITGYTPKDWGIVTELDPKEWHDLLTSSSAPGEPEITLLDVRNHYESAIGYFVSGSNSNSNSNPNPENLTIATRPPIRRFSQFPQYIRKRGLAALSPHPSNPPTKLLSYCTGGIRCEKATRFLAETLPAPMHISTLRGGIAAYLIWIDGEIRAGNLTAADSAFKGRNYVFDLRGSVGLAGGGDDIVGRCVRCTGVGGRMRTCGSEGCRLEVVVCGGCEGGDEDVVCCADCRDRDRGSGVEGGRGMCQCEKEREARLWGDDDGGGKAQGKQGWRTKRRKELMQVGSGEKEKVDIQVRLIRPERGLIQ